MANEVTLLLWEIKNGKENENREAVDKLLPIVYNELRKLAANSLNHEYAVSLQTTEIVHEAYFKLNDQRKWETIKKIFSVVVDLPKENPFDLLARETDEEIRREVENLLEGYEHPRRFY